MWGFHAVREKAIKNISSSGLDPVDQIILSKKYDVPAWLVPSLQALARLDEPMNMEDTRRLSKVAGWEFAIHLGHVREAFKGSQGIKFCDLNWVCGYCGSGTAFTARCYSHSIQIRIDPSSTSVVSWPCVSCTTYTCQSHTNYSWNKPAAPTPVQRSSYDFTPTIRKEFGITD